MERRLPPGLIYQRAFLREGERSAILSWLQGLCPLWEFRFSTRRDLPINESQRRLLRPVYWLGAWQFACLGYYRPPHRTRASAVAAEPIPAVFGPIVERMEKAARSRLEPRCFPPGWHLNTCLINFYGAEAEGSKKEDAARLGEHRDFEPGPVASLSLGNRAFFQFVASEGRNSVSRPVHSQWLEDSAVQIFGGPYWKDKLFHRVQRVERKLPPLPVPPLDFATRRVNFTFRYIPKQDICPAAQLPKLAKEDIAEYLITLAESSVFFKKAAQASGLIPPES